MGIYDTYGSVQLKVGDVDLSYYEIGAKVPLDDGIYIGHEGFIVIKNGTFVAEFDHAITKWGWEISPEEVLNPHDPFLAAMNSAKKEHNEDS